MKTNNIRLLSAILVGICAGLTALYVKQPLSVLLGVSATSSIAFISGWLIGWDRAAETYTEFRAELEEAHHETKRIEEEMAQLRHDFCRNLDRQS